MARFVEQRGRTGVARGGAAGRARAPSRAAASGADPDGHQARLFAQPAAPRLSGAAPQIAGACRSRSDWIEFAGGLVEIGHGGAGFAFDNETPRHKVWLEPFRLASRPVTCGEYLDFIDDGGYRGPNSGCRTGGRPYVPKAWEAPLYWRREDGGWSIFTLSGLRRLDPAEPIVTSAITKPKPMPNGPASGCRPRRNGRLRPRAFRSLAISPTAAISIRRRSLRRTLRLTPPRGRGRCSAMSGNGRRVPISPIRVFAPPRAQSANTTANLCVARWYCGAALPSPRRGTRERLIVISFRPRRAGLSPGCGLRRTVDAG